MEASTAKPGGVAVVTDTTHCLPPEMFDRLGVEQVSLYVGWDGDLKPEGEFADLDAFYKRLRESDSMPTTSQPSVGDFLAVYEPLVKSGRDVVSVHIAGGISGTVESARKAAGTLAEAGHPGRVEVVDSETGAGGLGCMVVGAADAAARGDSLDEVVASLARTRKSLDIWFCLDTLEFLRKGGRIGGAQAMIGTALKLKPILTFGTEIVPVEKVRTRRRALDRMDEYLQQLRDRGATDWIVQHIQLHEDADRLVAKGNEIFGKPPLFVTEVGPVLGAHLGSGVLIGGFERTG